MDVFWSWAVVSSGAIRQEEIGRRFFADNEHVAGGAVVHPIRRVSKKPVTELRSLWTADDEQGVSPRRGFFQDGSHQTATGHIFRTSQATHHGGKVPPT